MKAEVIIIGNELLKGSTRDINGYNLAKELTKRSISITHMQIIGDSEIEISQQIKIAKKRGSNLIFISGGVSPSINVQDNNCSIFILPGAPKEFSAMLSEKCLPLLDQQIASKQPPLRKFTIRTFGITKEVIFNQLCPTLWSELSLLTGSKQLSSLVNHIGVDIVIQISTTQDNFQQKVTKIKTFLQNSPLFPHIWHYGDESVEELIVKKLQQQKQTLSCAESCTGGLISHLITNIPRSSEIFPGSCITYSNQQKNKQLEIPEKTLNEYGAVSSQIALLMAKGVKKNLQTDFSIGITGVAGPGGGTASNPVGTVYFSIATPTETKVFHQKLSGSRELLKEQFANHALFAFYQELNQNKDIL